MQSTTMCSMPLAAGDGRLGVVASAPRASGPRAAAAPSPAAEDRKRRRLRFMGAWFVVPRYPSYGREMNGERSLGAASGPAHVSGVGGHGGAPFERMFGRPSANHEHAFVVKRFSEQMFATME